LGTLSIFDPWEIGGPTGRIECARPTWEEIAGFAMQGFQRSPSGGPEVGGLLLGHRTPGGVRIDAWREIACEHAAGPFFQLSEQDEGSLRLLLENSNGLEVVGWCQSKYWDTRWSQSQGCARRK
jgi:hypothetical protein